MKKSIAILLLVVMTGLWAAPVFGAEELSDNTKWRLYLAESKNPWAAVSLSIIPGGGHLYAGDWQRGLVFFGAYVLAGTWYNSTVNILGYPKNPNSSEYYISLYTTFGVLIFSMFDAYNATEKYNEKLREKYGLNAQLRNNLPVLAYTHSF